MGGTCVRSKGSASAHPRRTSSTVTTLSTSSNKGENEVVVTGTVQQQPTADRSGTAREGIEALWKAYSPQGSEILQDAEVDALFAALGVSFFSFFVHVFVHVFVHFSLTFFFSLCLCYVLSFLCLFLCRC